MTRTITTPKSTLTSTVTGPEMLAIMNIAPPDILVRSLTDPWMLGVYADQTGAKSVFVVATDNFFQNTFAGMLQWESRMADDLKLYLYTGTDFSLRGHYEDHILMNKDVRAYVTSDGKILFVYSFIDNNKLVIAGSEAALSEILSRLEKQAYVR